jgi:hypothetical protein
MLPPDKSHLTLPGVSKSMQGWNTNVYKPTSVSVQTFLFFIFPVFLALAAYDQAHTQSYTRSHMFQSRDAW